MGVGGWITGSHSCTRLPLTLLWIWWNWSLVMLPQLVTILYRLNPTAFFLSNKTGDLAGFFVLSRKDNICSSACGPFSTKSQWQYPFINLIFFISFFLVCTVSTQETEQNGYLNISHKSSGIKLLLTSSQRLREESVQEISTTNKTKKNRKNCSSSSERCAYKNVRELKQRRRRPQQWLKKKTIGLMIKTTALHVHHAF